MMGALVNLENLEKMAIVVLRVKLDLLGKQDEKELVVDEVSLEIPVPKESLGLEVLPVMEALMDQKDRRVKQVMLEHKVNEDQPELKVLKGKQVFQVQ